LQHLAEWRKTLCAELLQIKSPVRSREAIERSRDLTFSIRSIDFGFERAAPLGIVTLTGRLGELLRAAGYATDLGELYGPHGWRGSQKQVERRMAQLTARRAQLEALLADALLDDAARVKRDDARRAERARLDALPHRIVRGDGSMFDRYPNGREVDVEEPAVEVVE
jgi:hypothetical protein